MKILILASYALCVSFVVLALLYFANPYVVEFPKTSFVILALAMFTSIGTGVRSMLEMGVLLPMIKITKGNNKPFLACPFIFLVAMLIAIVLPWINGVSDFNVWNWISSIAFSLFNFETFYAFVCATLRMYKCGSETEYE